MRLLPTALVLLGLVLMFSTRFVGLYSHQLLGVVLFVGTLWAIPGRVRLIWKGELGWKELRQGDRKLRMRVAGRGLFWLVLGGSCLLVFPRLAEVLPMILVLGACLLLRIAVELLPPKDARLETTAVLALAAVLMAIDNGRALLPGPEPAMRLSSPFTSGDWIVVQGGPTPMQNHHRSDPRQSWALDLIRLDAEGRFMREAEGNAAFLGWEEPLTSPVAGRVVAVRGGIEDSVGLNLVDDMALAAGNYVVIESEGVYVLLAHLREDTVEVAPGDEVEVGTPLGLVGNSGNTTMPHLHLQVQTHAELLDPANRSLPFAFGGGAPLARNQRVRPAVADRAP